MRLVIGNGGGTPLYSAASSSSQWPACSSWLDAHCWQVVRHLYDVKWASLCRLTVLLAWPSVVVKTFFRSRDQDWDLGLQVSRPRPKPWTSGLETETKVFRSRDQDRDLGLQISRLRLGQNELESRDHGLEITTLAASIPIGDRALP